MEYPVPRRENPLFLFWRILWTFCFCTSVFALVVAFFSLNTGFTGMTPPILYIIYAMAAAVLFPLYTMPSYFAFRKGMEERKKLLLCNLFLGWTAVGYILCAVRVKKAPIKPAKK